MKNFKKIATLMLMILVTATAAGCSGTSGGDKGKDLAAVDIYAAVTSGIDFTKTVDLKDTRLADKYYIDLNMVEEYAVKISSINISAAEVAVFKLKDAKNAEAVKAGIAKRQADIVKDFANYLPAQGDLATNGQIVVKGRYILFVISADADKAVAAFNALFK